MYLLSAFPGITPGDVQVVIIPDNLCAGYSACALLIFSGRSLLASTMRLMSQARLIVFARPSQSP